MTQTRSSDGGHPNNSAAKPPKAAYSTDEAHPTVARICCRWGPAHSDVIAVARNLHVFEFDARGGGRCRILQTCRAVC
jgi:hypothetical protein